MAEIGAGADAAILVRNRDSPSIAGVWIGRCQHRQFRADDVGGSAQETEPMEQRGGYLRQRRGHSDRDRVEHSRIVLSAAPPRLCPSLSQPATPAAEVDGLRTYGRAGPPFRFACLTHENPQRASRRWDMIFLSPPISDGSV